MGGTKKLGIAVPAAVSVACSAARGASAAVQAPGPCEQQRALFERYDLELKMSAPLVSYAHDTVCDQTG